MNLLEFAGLVLFVLLPALSLRSCCSVCFTGTGMENRGSGGVFCSHSF